MIETDEKKVHRNMPQLLFWLIQCKINVLIWARGTGKTSGPLADFSATNVTEMPRSNGAFYCNSYADLLTKVMPAVVEGWSQWGYEENIHYFIGKFAPDKYNWPRAYKYPRDSKYYTHWYNGSGIFLVSGDHAVTNGNSVDWGAVDESRLQNYSKVREFLLTIRGGAQYFGGKSCHHSILYLSDMPRSSKEKWLLDFKDKMNPDIIDRILQIQFKLNDLYTLLENAKEENRNDILKQVDFFLRALDKLRQSTVYFSTATTLDNVHALGMDPIKNFRNILNELDFMISVLNMEIVKIEKGFYPILDEDTHGYFADDVSYIDSLNLQYDVRNAKKTERTCLWDADRIDSEPLDISADYNAAINSVVVGQQHGKEYRMLNSMFVLSPKFLKDLAEDFCKYYAAHGCREINLVCDNTGIAQDAAGNVSFADEWLQVLTHHGWNVNKCYIGQAPKHHTRYWTWHTLLTEEDTTVPISFRYNRNNCSALYTSMSQAPLKQVGDEYKKDKASERAKDVKPQDATHMSEAADILIHWKIRQLTDGAGAYIGTSFPK